MFEKLRESMDRRPSRFSRNVARLSPDTIPRPGEWTIHTERRYVWILILAALLTALQWAALTFVQLRRRVARLRRRL
ncbi:MAG TPA: hypothetical protein VMS98_11235 [Thermoanaerobaculia bacterium]|nr:hypothetical protein [Thermoanaerobaculia bacterium]